MLTKWFRAKILESEAEALKTFKTLYVWGFGILCASILCFILSSIRVVQVPLLIIGAMLQINSILFFLYAGLIKIGWELRGRSESSTPHSAM